MAETNFTELYHPDLRTFERILLGVRRPGDYFVAGSLETAMPRVEVDGVGLLSFPVPEVQAHALIALATRAPYGRGPETLVDESVRKVWQLPPDLLKLGGKSWPATFAQILDRVAAGLGCNPGNVEAELYKFLVYDQGGFFRAHRDTEKRDAMFGTLVVVLPCEHEGGDLLIRHADREARVPMCHGDVSELQFAAFYADCEHEILPVTRGTRVCLVYNLLARRPQATDPVPTAPVYSTEIAALAESLRDAFGRNDAPAKLAWLLEHHYSPSGLAFAALKGADAARADVLRAAADRAGCALHLGIVHIEESGPAEPEYEPTSKRSRWLHRHDAASDFEEDDVGARYTPVEISDSDRHIDEWRDSTDKPVDFGALPLANGEVLPAGALDDEDPDEDRLTEATGNEGATFERSYHRASMVVWPRDRFVGILLQSGVGAALPYLEERIAEATAPGATPAARQTALDVAARIVRASETSTPDRSWRSRSRPEDRGRLLGLLTRLADPALIARYVSGPVMDRFDETEAPSLAEAASVLSATACGVLCAALTSANGASYHRGCTALLHALLRRVEPASHPDWHAAVRRIAEAAIAELPKIGLAQNRHPLGIWNPRKSDAPPDTEEIVQWLEILEVLNSDTLNAAALNAFRQAPAVFDPVTALVPALERRQAERSAAAGGDSTTTALWQHAAGFLLARSEQPPPAPTDWCQTVSLDCRCELCSELTAFCRDALAQVHHFRVRKDRRMHLHGQIDRHGLDMTHVTERYGSPQTLVCTKTRTRYRDRCAQHAADCAAMEALVRLAPQPGGLMVPAELVARLDAARTRKPATIVS